MKEHKQGKLKYGSGKKAKSRKQAVAIALSEARRQREMILSKSRGTSATTELAGFGSSFLSSFSFLFF